MKVKKLLLILSLWALALGCIAVSISSSPDPLLTPASQAFVLAVNLDTATQIRGYSIRMSFDASVLSFTTANKGSLFTGLPINWWRIFDESPGVIRIECIIFGAGLYTTGPGNLINLSFNAIAEGYSALDFITTELYDPAGAILPEFSSSAGNIIVGTGISYAKAKCWLQGAYDEGSMRTVINSILPLTSPYAAAPVTVNSIPNDVVDWVLVELRSGANARPTSSQSAFLGQDGLIRSIGKPYLIFRDASPGPYYLVIRHRNHLALMSSSATAFSLSGSPVLIDLSVANNIYGQGAFAALGDDICGLIAGDADMDGGIFPSDRNAHWRVQSGGNGYKSADFNLDGNVFPNDLNGFWRVNSGLGSQVPAPIFTGAN